MHQQYVQQQQPVRYVQQQQQPQQPVQYQQAVQYQQQAQQPVQYIQHQQQPVQHQQAVQYVQQPQASVRYVQPQGHYVQPAQQQAPLEPDPQAPAMDAQTYQNMKMIFAKYDTDQSNTLSTPELVQVMQEVGMEVPADVGSMFAEYDTDNNGKISFTEFMAAFQTAPNTVQPNVQMNLDEAGKFIDMDFPPTNDSIYASPNPAADHVQDVVNHAGGQGVQVEWRRLGEICQNGRLFHHVHPNDIAQGVLGDCWLLAAMAGLAEFEGAVLHLFKDKKVNDLGMYTINIHNPVTKQWEAVVVDDYIPLGPNGEPLMAKPQDNEMWVLLLEKAFAKWFGSYCQIQGAYCLVGFMFMAEVDGHCKCFTQNAQGRPPFNENVFTVVGAHIQDAHNRNSVGLTPMGQIDENSAWTELVKHDAANHIMCAWTSKDPGTPAGRGASGELIASDGIVKGHAYSMISAREVQADQRVWRVVQLRNPWGANPAAEWKGALSDHWQGWGQYPELYQALEMGQGQLDGMFWMSWDDFRRRYSDIGVVPKQMEVPRSGVIEGAGGPPTAKHGKKFKSQSAQRMQAPAAMEPQQYAQEPQYAPHYIQPSQTIYHQQQQVAYAAAPAATYTSAPAVTYAAAPAYTAAPAYAAAPQMIMQRP